MPNHQWGYDGRLRSGAKLWHCAGCLRSVQGESPPEDACDEGGAAKAPDAGVRARAAIRRAIEDLGRASITSAVGDFPEARACVAAALIHLIRASHELGGVPATLDTSAEPV